MTGWLSLLTTERLEDAEKLIQEYPWLQEIYEEIAMLRQRPEEVLGMFSEALRILDENTIKYMVEEMQKELDKNKALLEKNAEVIKAKEAALEEKNAQIAELQNQLRNLTHHQGRN